jgi:flagellar biosynthesis protein FlhA
MSTTTAATQTQRFWYQDLAIPAGVVGIVLIMILPLPALALDLLLATSICLSLCMLLVAVFLNRPLDFSVFPTALLITTMLRLALNIASTRLILLHGAEGPQAAGQVIQAFGRFVVGGSTIVGVIIFLILALINFIVITKGSGRIAEVAARFTLDSLPGKQMAIDADLAAGLLSEEQARTRRKELEGESDFYGAMDGASKFVRGDAIAGLIITGINIVGGLIIGVLQEGLPVAEAAQTYTLLTVGDGLVSQIPSLLISSAAGIIVTRAAGDMTLGENIGEQLFGNRKPMAMAAGIMALMAFVPGMPTIPFLTLAGVVGYGAYRAGKRKENREQDTVRGADQPPASEVEREKITSLLPVDLLELEVGYELVALVDPKQGGDLVDRMAALRRSFAQELGIIVPPVHIRDNLQLGPNKYRILLSGSTIGEGELKPGYYMAMDSGGVTEQIKGAPTREPAFGLPAIWVAARERDRAEMVGYTVVDCTTVVATHLTELIRAHAAELLGRAEAQDLLDTFAASNPRLIEDLIPSILTLGEVVRVLRGLLEEGIGIRDMRTILEALADHGAVTKNTTVLIELVRQKMARAITERFRSPEGRVDALVLDASFENIFRESMVETSAGIEFAPLSPTDATRIIQGFERASRELVRISTPPVLVTAPDIRRAVLSFVQQRVPGLQVISYREIESGTPVKPLAIVRQS